MRKARVSTHGGPGRGVGEAGDPLPVPFPFVKVDGPVEGTDGLPYPNLRVPMMPRLLVLVALSATAALASPTAAQAPDSLALSYDAADTRSVAVAALERRIEEARQSHERNRLLGTGLIATGALALVGPFMDWAERDQIGMRPAATGVMLAGVTFVAWGAHRRHMARQALQRAETWEARVQAARDAR